MDCAHLGVPGTPLNTRQSRKEVGKVLLNCLVSISDIMEFVSPPTEATDSMRLGSLAVVLNPVPSAYTGGI